MSSFWHWYIVIPTVLGLVGCFWLLRSNQKGVESDQQAAEKHVWDEDLTEYNNPLPRWWLNLFLITLAFGAVYLVLYPGLGNFKGFLGWTGLKQYEAEVLSAETTYGPLYKQYAETSITELAKNPAAIRTGQRLFSNYCATCHGSDARGATGFPDLRDTEWLYGGTPEAIKTTLTNGRSGVMPPWSAAMDDTTLNAVVEYVQSLSTGEGNAELLALGKEKFNTFCIACHGPQGKGNVVLGAPDLTNNIWLYGGSDRVLLQTLKNGRIGKMPAHGEFLGSDKVHVLSAYVYSLGLKAK
ncbi:MAG: cytochrome-c oxidase, cbb3-type subunit III [Granulosicoccus sp.]|nr:cytochrome-c oxidase, cbb3-type subunit III [Granulosicoccus sp.]